MISQSAQCYSVQVSLKFFQFLLSYNFHNFPCFGKGSEGINRFCKFQAGTLLFAVFMVTRSKKAIIIKCSLLGLMVRIWDLVLEATILGVSMNMVGWESILSASLRG